MRMRPESPELPWQVTDFFGREQAQCPVDGCDWHYELPSRPPGLPSARIMVAWADGVDHVLRTHAESHPPLHYLQTIQRLNTDLRDARNERDHLQGLLHEERNRS